MATSCTLTLDLTEKTLTQSVQIAFREAVTVVISGAPAGTVAANLRLYLISIAETLMAECLVFTEDGDNFTGTLDLSTDELTTFFGDAICNEKRTFNLQLWDAVEEALLANHKLRVQNNPWDPDMADPTAVDPISFS